MKQQKFLTGFLTLVLIIASLNPGFGQTQAQESEPYVPSGILVTELGDEVPPGRLNVRFPSRDPVHVGEEIRTILQKLEATPDRAVLAQTVPDITPEIQTLATGLENDPLAIYDYVHNHIDYIPSWGLLKNPRETLLAGAGNAFDQAALLSALLEAAGFQTRYVWGNIRVTKAEAMNWVGSDNPSTVGNVFASGGIPTWDEGSTLLMTHIWVQVSDGGTWYSLDPSFKAYTEQAEQDLRPLLGYDLPTFISDAEDGATITGDYVQNLNQANIRDDLGTYALNLVNYLRDHDTFIYPEELIGGRQIVPIESSSYPSSLPYEVTTTLGQATDIPDSFAYELTIQLPGIDYTVNVDDIAGERITIFYECATPADCQRLEDGGGVYNVEPAYLVNMVPKLRIGGTVVDTGDAVPLGSWEHQLDVILTTPIDGWAPSFSQFLVAGEWYSLPMRLQTVSNRGLARQVDLLNETMAQGLAPGDEGVLGQILYLLGLSYFNEVDLGDRIDSRLAKIVHIPHFSMMIASRNLVVWIDALQRPVALDPASHTVDVRLNVHSAVSAENPANADRERAWFLSTGMRSSAVEHAIIEQLQPVSAISTVQILNSAIQEGQPIYYITPDNKDDIIPLLGHSYAVTMSVTLDVTGVPPRHVVISQDPVTYGEWQGSGWITLDPDSGSAGYLISGYLGSTSTPALPIISGGGGAYPQPPGDSLKLAVSVRTVDRSSREQIDRQDPGKTIETLEEVAQPKPDPTEKDDPGISTENTAGDPVNATAGSFLYRHVDLSSLGGLGIPLLFERFYASSRHSLTSTLGYGWSHTYNTRFYTSTDWVRGFARRTVLEAAPALASMQVGLDLFDATNIPHQRFGIDITAAHWLMTQVTNNAATLREPDGSVSAYVHLIDDAYQPPASRPNLNTVTAAGDGSVTLDWEDGTRSRFGADGRPIALDDANGNRTTLSYDGQGRLNRVSDPVGRSLVFNYDAQNRIYQVTDPANRTFRYSYDGQGHLRTYTDPAGEVTTYAYDTNRRLIAVTDPLGVPYVTNQYNAMGWVETQTNGLGSQTSLLYGGDHNIVIDPMGYRTTYYFDERNRLLSIQDALGNRRSAAYDAADHETIRTNGLDQSITLAYNTWGRLTTTTDLLGHTTTWSYDPTGNPVSYTNQLGETWQFAHDGRHNLISITTPLGDTTDYEYNSRGQLTHAENDAGVYAIYSYDTHGYLTNITNALGGSHWGCDIVGRPISFTNGTDHTFHFSYDVLDNLVQITDPLGHSTSYGYDANRNPTSITDANGNTTTYTYDAQFNLTGLTDPMGQATSYEYDANDRLVSITDANNHKTTYRYDPVGRLVAISDPLTRSVTFTYDAADRLVAFGRADGSSIGYQRDAMGRLTKVDYPTDPDITYDYDAVGNLTRAAYGGNWSASYSYDDAGRLITIDDESRDLTTGYEYDAASRRTRLQVKRNMTVLYDVAYEYDDSSRLTTLTDQASTPAKTVQSSYDAAGRLKRITYPDNARTDYTYDAAGRVTVMNHQDDQGDLIASHTYSYDPVGNPVAVNETTPVGSFAATYAYDPLDRLTRETYPRYSVEYSYDPAGNMIRRQDPLGALNSTYDSADQLQSQGSESFDYDQHGNLVTWQNDRGTYHYAYNYENLLANLTLPGGAALTFTRDAFGRRLAFQGPAGAGSYLHDGLVIVLEGNGDLSQTTARYLHGINSLVARYTEQLGFTTYLGDALENVRYLLNGNGQPFNAYHYEAYGQTAQPAGVDSNPFRFDGKQGVLQPDVPSWPMHLTVYRDYAPLGGRFTTRDPLPGNRAWSPTLNDYQFGLGNPIANGDPSGLREDREYAGLAEPNDPYDLIHSDHTGLRPEHEGTGLGEPSDIIASSIREDGYVALDFQLTTNLRPAGQSKRRSVPPTRPESMPAEMTGWPQDKYNGQLKITSLGTDSTRWLPIFTPGSAFALACTTDDRLLAGAFHDGLFRSIDTRHTTWAKAYTASVGEIAIIDTNTYYAGTWYSGTLKSSDGGVSWTPTNNGLTANHVYALAADPLTSNRLFAGTEMGLYVSQDGGASWGRPAGALPGRSVLEIAFADNFLLAVTELGLYRSPDGGSTWLTPTVDLPTVRINTLLVGSPTSTVYAATALGPYKSTDNGDTWTPLGTGLADSDVYALAVDPAEANHMAAGTTDGLFVSTDGGATWAPDTHEGLYGVASQIGALAFCPNGGDINLYLGTGGGVYALRTSVAPISVTITGPATGIVHTNYTFTATVSPVTTTLPLTYVWETTDHSPVINAAVNSLTDTVPFAWDTSGRKVITATVSNSVGTTSTTHTVTISLQPPTEVSISGPTTGVVGTNYTFTATVSPVTTTMPLTYVWEAMDQDTVTHAGIYSRSDAMSFDWSMPGRKLITVTVSNQAGMASATHVITITVAPQAPTGVSIDGPTTGVVGTNYTFTATVSPLTVTLPVTYAWEATGQDLVTHADVHSRTDAVPFTWSSTGVKAITVTVSNQAGTTSATHIISITRAPQAPTGLTIAGPARGTVDTSYTFTATVSPLTVTLPVTYAWEATGQDLVTHADVHSRTDAVPFTWSSTGVKAITVTVTNRVGVTSATHTIKIDLFKSFLPLILHNHASASDLAVVRLQCRSDCSPSSYDSVAKAIRTRH
jgi:RHS repeat-associated protein